MARADRLPGRDDLVSGRQDRNARAGVHAHAGLADGGKGADLRGGQEFLRAHDDGPAGDVLPAARDALARVHGRVHLHRIAVALRVLDHDDRVRAARQRRARRDLRASAGDDALARDRVRVERLDPPQRDGSELPRPERVARDHRIAVHRGAVLEGDVNR